MQLSKLENSGDKKISRLSSDDCVLLLNPHTCLIAIWEPGTIRFNMFLTETKAMDFFLQSKKASNKERKKELKEDVNLYGSEVMCGWPTYFRASCLVLQSTK